VADFSSDYHSYRGATIFPPCPLPPGNCGPFTPELNFVERNYLFGPRVGPQLGKIRPFGEFLVGAAHVSLFEMMSFSPGVSAADTSFATAVGGGFDYRIIRILGWRLEGDYIHTAFFGSTQNNARITTGVFLHF
jgi:hypothetical protein